MCVCVYICFAHLMLRRKILIIIRLGKSRRLLDDACMNVVRTSDTWVRNHVS